MPENSFSFPTWQRGSIEKLVILDGRKEILKYSLSNSLDDIKIAIFVRTGYNINLENAAWKLNPKLSISVKHLMDSHDVNYSMTTYIREKVRFVVINMRVGDNWFITGYEEINGKFYNWELIHTYSKAMKIAMDMFNDSNSSL
jgi:hypothetical protein